MKTYENAGNVCKAHLTENNTRGTPLRVSSANHNATDISNAINNGRR